tara:strand:- start:22634 stop:22861 length:228 start_codon:yes stop_codon:yes gene_type:complete
LPSFADDASVDASLALSAGAKDFLMGWKALRTVAGRRRLALARRIPLQFHLISAPVIINWVPRALFSPLQHCVGW